MILTFPQTELPPDTKIWLSGNELDDARIEEIAFHGGVVGVMHQVVITPSKAPLTRGEELTLGLSAVGMSETQIAEITSSALIDIQRRRKRVNQELGATGRLATAIAVKAAFSTGIFVVKKSIELEGFPDPKTTEILHRTSLGQSATSIAEKLDLTFYDVRSHLETFSVPRELSNTTATVFYSYLAGILPATEQ